MFNIEGFSSYSITEDGRIFKGEREISQMINGGFLCANMVNDEGKRSLQKVHRLLAITFLGVDSSRYFKVFHKDGNKLNNSLDNLGIRFPKVGGRGFNNPTKPKNLLEGEALAKWTSMLSRTSKSLLSKGYSTNYSGVSVCDEWLDFSQFSEWYYQERSLWVGYEHPLELDKDILNPSAKRYSKDTCSLVPSSLNTLFRRSHPVNLASLKREYKACRNYLKKDIKVVLVRYYLEEMEKEVKGLPRNPYILD